VQGKDVLFNLGRLSTFIHVLYERLDGLQQFLYALGLAHNSRVISKTIQRQVGNNDADPNGDRRANGIEPRGGEVPDWRGRYAVD
jgi:hypothetical protein